MSYAVWQSNLYSYIWLQPYAEYLDEFAFLTVADFLPALFDQ